MLLFWNVSYHKAWLNSWLCSWLCPLSSGVEEANDEPTGAEVDWTVPCPFPCPFPFPSPFPSPESGFWDGGTGCERPKVAPSRRWRERSPARKRAYSFGVCRSSIAIFGELKVWMSRPIKSKILFSWSFVKKDENSGRRSYNNNSPQYKIKLLEGMIKCTLRRNAEAKDAKTKWPKKVMTIKSPKMAPDGMETDHQVHSAYNRLVQVHRSCFLPLM